jgi:hypothetical protein
MARHYPKSRLQGQQEREQEQPKEKGWYCVSHSVKFLCEICGYDINKKGEAKYYFISG